MDLRTRIVCAGSEASLCFDVLLPAAVIIFLWMVGRKVPAHDPAGPDHTISIGWVKQRQARQATDRRFECPRRSMR